jgi:hypothetical protein
MRITKIKLPAKLKRKYIRIAIQGMTYHERSCHEIVEGFD